MEVFLLILERLIPLYLLVILGFIAGKFLPVSRNTIAVLLIYLITPLVMFNGLLSLKLSPERVFLPVLFFCICSIVCLSVYRITRAFWRTSPATRNLASFAAGNANTGYFGLPVSMAILGPEVMGLVLLIALGFSLYENSVGFFMTARGRHSWQEALSRVARLPALYAFFAGVACSSAGLKLGPLYEELFVHVRGTYSVLGMMMIGLGMAGVSRVSFDWKLVGTTLFTKFLIWPLIGAALVSIDRTWLHWFDPQTHSVFFIMSAVPLAANTVSVAEVLKTEPEKAAVAVLLSTLFALFFIPLMGSFWGWM